jgi:hypothetical protein
MKIKTSEAIRRFNEQLEEADIALGLAAVDVDDPRKILSLLNIAGRHELARTFKEAARAVGYFPISPAIPAPPSMPIKVTP